MKYVQNMKDSIIEDVQEKISSKCDEIKELLLQKNKAYGSSALDPINVFYDGDPSAGLKVRIDDKLKRIQNVGINEETEDSLKDLTGYLILLMISRDESNNISKRIREDKSPLPNYGSSSTANPEGQIFFHDQ